MRGKTVADIVDRAQEREEAHRARAIEAARRVMRPGRQRIRDGRVVCLDCGEPIPAGRLAVVPTAVRCLGCQRAHEEGAW
ncbi:MAG: TraR/DksA family transcriptional regulator [Candidatus Dadabacteria bacterium]|nr:MAG: TraR/DksA family transcriptional regulator [Candidatus Dadabacteria bacterium]